MNTINNILTVAKKILYIYGNEDNFAASRILSEIDNVRTCTEAAEILKRAKNFLPGLNVPQQLHVECHCSADDMVVCRTDAKDSRLFVGTCNCGTSYAMAYDGTIIATTYPSTATFF